MKNKVISFFENSNLKALLIAFITFNLMITIGKLTIPQDTLNFIEILLFFTLGSATFTATIMLLSTYNYKSLMFIALSGILLSAYFSSSAILEPNKVNMVFTISVILITIIVSMFCSFHSVKLKPLAA